MGTETGIGIPTGLEMAEVRWMDVEDTYRYRATNIEELRIHIDDITKLLSFDRSLHDKRYMHNIDEVNLSYELRRVK